MQTLCFFVDSLPAEHRALCREYAAVQVRCSQLIAQQRAEIEQLQAQVVRLRAAAIVQVSALAFVQCKPAPLPSKLALREISRAAAEGVICQTGCLSHGAYWRDHEHCRRTGTACIVPEAPATTHLMVKTAPSLYDISADSYQNK